VDVGYEDLAELVLFDMAEAGLCVCVVLHVAVYTGTSAMRPVSPHTSKPRFTLTHY
jgi:hypothetical protein